MLSAWQAADLTGITSLIAGFSGQDNAAVATTLARYRLLLPHFAEFYQTPQGCAAAVSMRLSRLNEVSKRSRPVVAAQLLVPVFEEFFITHAARYAQYLEEAISEARTVLKK